MHEPEPPPGDQSRPGRADRAGTGAGDGGGGGKRSPLLLWAAMAVSVSLLALLACIWIAVLYQNQNHKPADAKMAAAAGEEAKDPAASSAAVHPPPETLWKPDSPAVAPPQANTNSGADLTAPVEGIAAGATLGLPPVRVEDVPDESSTRRFILHIPIKARPKARMEVRELVIHVLFYDILDGQKVVQTSGEVNSRWVSPPADWMEGDTEELAVEYRLPKPEAKAAKREDRKYYGYIVRIYYKKQLQAAKAEPERLSRQYPPPRILSDVSD